MFTTAYTLKRHNENIHGEVEEEEEENEEEESEEEEDGGEIATLNSHSHLQNVSIINRDIQIQTTTLEHMKRRSSMWETSSEKSWEKWNQLMISWKRNTTNKFWKTSRHMSVCSMIFMCQCFKL
ncbi:MAG: hypothetical protein GY738_04720 [Pseudoalteromonas sp.]|nr:hypothetical protein [Pseudoalteromonas sp.]